MADCVIEVDPIQGGVVNCITEEDLVSEDGPAEDKSSKSAEKLRSLWKKIKVILALLASLSYFTYLGFAIYFNFSRAIPVIYVTGFCVFCVTYSTIKERFGARFAGSTLKQHILQIERIWNKISKKATTRLLLYSVIITMVTYVVVTNLQTPRKLVSLSGIVVLVLFSWIISYHPRKINTRPVIWGLAIQFLIGLFVLRTDIGRDVFKFLGNQVEQLLSNVIAGVKFVFGDKYMDFEFAFKLMPTVIFVNSLISILYHLGWMQMLVTKVAMLLHVTMGTTAAETVCTAACIFLGQPEASFIIRPYLSVLTRSELHAIMTAGFASVSADIFGLFVSYGISSSHILTASLMSAPAALAISKIVCPETEVSNTKTWKQIQQLDTRQQTSNVLDAAGRGAVDALYVVLGVCATLIAFLSILAFLNSTLGYLGSLVNIQDFSFEMVLSYLLTPLVYVMGVPWEDCRIVAEVVGLKTIVNEFVGYLRLGEYIQQGKITLKSQIIATYALCGFSNPTSVGITLSGLGVLVPDRKSVLSKLVIRAWISGSVACFLTACFAGLLHHDGITLNSTPPLPNTTLHTVTY